MFIAHSYKAGAIKKGENIMNKLFTKIVGTCLGLAMAVGTGVAVATGASKEAAPVHADVGDTVTIGTGSYESVYETGFESATAGTTYNSTQTYNSTAGDGASWSVYYGTVSTNAKITGTKSMQMRWYSTATTNYPHAETTSAISNVKAFKFNYAVGNKNVNFKVQYGTDGSSWTDIETVAPSGTSTTAYSHEFTSAVSTFYFRVLVCLGTAPTSGNYTFRIDDVVFGKEIKTLDSISAALTNSSATWYVGNTVTASDLTVTPHYTDSTDGDPITDGTGVTVTNGTLGSVGSNTVNVSYGGKSTTVTVTAQAARTMTGIALHGAIEKDEYYVGDSWDLTGLDIQVNWSTGDPTYVDLDDADVVYECTPDTATSTSVTEFDIEVLYDEFDETFTVDGLTVSERPFADVLTETEVGAQTAEYSSGWAVISNIEDYTGAKYSMRTMKPSSSEYTMSTNANGYFLTTTCPSNAKVKSISVDFLTSGKNLAVYGSNTAYTAGTAPSSTSVGTISGNGGEGSFDFSSLEDDYKYVAFKGTGSSTVVGNITVTYESLDPTLEFTAGGTTASLHVVNGSTNSTTFEAENFASVSAELFSNNSGSHSSLGYTVNGTTVTVTATGTSVGDDSFTISATGCETTLTLNVTVQASTTFDSLVISTATTATEFNEDDAFAVTDLVVTANYTVGGAAETVEFSSAEGNLDQLTYTVGGNVMEIGDSLTSTGTLAVVVSYSDSTTGTTRSASSYNITVNAYVAHTWTKVTSAPADWRGTYLLVYEDDTDAYIFNSSLETVDATFNTVSGTISSNSITGSKTIDAVAVKIERNTVSGTSYYHAKCANGGYLKSSNKGIDTQATATATNAVTFNEDNAMVIGNYILRFNTTANQMRFRFGESSYGAATCLYKMDTTSTVEAEVSTFVSGFYSSIDGVCDPDGVETNVTTLNSAWSSQSTAFKALSVDAQAILANTTYTHDEETPGTTKYIIDKYDYVYGKYSESLTKGDFMNRTEAGTLVSYSSFSKLSILGDNTNVIAIIVVISLVGVTTIGGYFFLRKRKEHN